MKKILVLDNYDSFTYNLVQLVNNLSGRECSVIRNDKLSLSDAAGYEKILLSPGPGLPSEAGLMPVIVKELAAKVSILGVCLGHQCIAEVFGGKLINMTVPVHGKSSVTRILDHEEILFRGLPETVETGRYHSWLVDATQVPECLHVTAVDEKGDVMALAHRELDVRGVQFHPESVMTPLGYRMIKNWLEDKEEVI